ncbi:unnamed protein product [Enterobius vermicularis]|uniref:Transposase n=1 Tax=Enterobius vermicularis TaxID=51028 RepID=A0A0N4VB36_ENTVE|nr:unnamed protein product [Enterobius vermicularis]
MLKPRLIPKLAVEARPKAIFMDLQPEYRHLKHLLRRKKRHSTEKSFQWQKDKRISKVTIFGTFVVFQAPQSPSRFSYR